MRRRNMRGALAMAVGGGVEDEDEAPLTSQLVPGKPLVMEPSKAQQLLETARTRLMEQRKPDKSAQWLAFAQGMLSPTKTGSFGETLGTTAGLVGKARATEKKRQTDIDKELLETEVDLEKVSAGYGSTGAERQWQELIKDLSPEDKVKATRMKLGLEPKAVGSSAITTALNGWAEIVGASEALIAGRKKFAQQTAVERSKSITESYATIQKLDANMRNIDRAIAELHRGAKTGFIERFIPSVRESSIIFDQIQKVLGLDIVGATTFGALSKGELDLALAVAIPTALEPPELIEWFENRKIAQGKLRAYVEEQMDFMDTHEGATQATWMRHKNRQMKESEAVAAEATAGLEGISDEALAAAIKEAGG